MDPRAPSRIVVMSELNRYIVDTGRWFWNSAGNLEQFRSGGRARELNWMRWRWPDAAVDGSWLGGAPSRLKARRHRARRFRRVPEPVDAGVHDRVRAEGVALDESGAALDRKQPRSDFSSCEFFLFLSRNQSIRKKDRWIRRACRRVCAMPISLSTHDSAGGSPVALSRRHTHRRELLLRWRRVVPRLNAHWAEHELQPRHSPLLVDGE